MRSPEELREDKSVFMNQGEWELLHILSKYKSFSVDNDDYYAEMKFHVRLLHISDSVIKKQRSIRVFPGGDSAAAVILHGKPAAAKHLLNGDGHRWLLLAAGQRREGFLQDHPAAGIFGLPHHRLRHAARHRHRNPADR